MCNLRIRPEPNFGGKSLRCGRTFQKRGGAFPFTGVFGHAPNAAFAKGLLLNLNEKAYLNKPEKDRSAYNKNEKTFMSKTLNNRTLIEVKRRGSVFEKLDQKQARTTRSQMKVFGEWLLARGI
jgi:hypothetical protein